LNELDSYRAEAFLIISDEVDSLEAKAREADRKKTKRG